MSRPRLITSIALGIFVALPLLLYCAGVLDCNYRVIDRKPSEAVSAVLYEKRCSFPRSVSYNVSILREGQDILDERAIVFSAEAEKVAIDWLRENDRTLPLLEITHGSIAESFRKRDTFKSIRIVYKEASPSATPHSASPEASH